MTFSVCHSEVKKLFSDSFPMPCTSLGFMQGTIFYVPTPQVQTPPHQAEPVTQIHLLGGFFYSGSLRKAWDAPGQDSKTLPDILRLKGNKIATSCTIQVIKEIPTAGANQKNVIWSFFQSRKRLGGLISYGFSYQMTGVALDFWKYWAKHC